MFLLDNSINKQEELLFGGIFVRESPTQPNFYLPRSLSDKMATFILLKQILKQL
jgi:hypothetical protein